MKAILVLDEMPEQCDDCVFCQGGYSLSYLCGLTGAEFEFINGKRKDFCPLKSIPQKKILDEELFMSGNYRLIQARFTGWNDCIDTLLGETE